MVSVVNLNLGFVANDLVLKRSDQILLRLESIAHSNHFRIVLIHLLLRLGQLHLQ